jgi:hypothetical protein
MLNRHFIVIAVCLAAALGLGAASTLAQDDAACLTLVQSAVNQTSTQCATPGADSVCYGHPNVTGSFRAASEQSQPVFTRPGDQADLLITEAIQTGPPVLSPDPATWGMAMMNVQAGLPNEILTARSGKGLILIQLGGVEVENAVEPEEALVLPTSGVPVVTIAAADMRSAPVAHDTATGTNVMARVPAETIANAYAVSQNGDWVRVVYQNQAGWISSATLADADLSGLPTVGPDTFTPMQSFYFRNGILNGAPRNCSIIPSLLLVQGPENTPVYLRVHGVDLKLESTALLRTLPPGDTLGDFFEVIGLFGMVTLFPDTDNEVLVPPGFVARIQLGQFVSLGIEGDDDEKALVGFVGSIRPLTTAEIDLFRILERLPGNILHYIPEIPTIVQPSGIGQVMSQLAFNNPVALNLAQRACQSGRLPAEVCEVLGL